MRLPLAAAAALLLALPAAAEEDTLPPSTSFSVRGPYLVLETTAPTLVALGDASRIVLAAADSHSGVAETWYRLDGGEPVLYEEPFRLPSPSGEKLLAFWSVDHAGNSEVPRERRVFLDEDAPSVEVVSPRPGHLAVGTLAVPVPVEDAWVASWARFEATAEDALPVASVDFGVDGETWCSDRQPPFECEWAQLWPQTRHTLVVTATDAVGNARSESVPFRDVLAT